MAPTIILIRHAQGIHSKASLSTPLMCFANEHIDTYQDDWEYPFNDPPLTELGHSQCAELSRHLQSCVPISHEIELILTSPMQRTLQTASLALDFLLSRPSPVPAIALAEWQETEDSRCDTGAKKTARELKIEWPGFNWDHLDPIWPSKDGLYEYSKEAIEERGRTVKQWLKNRKEKVIAVVSHAGFIRAGVCGRAIANADFRIFDFVEHDESDNDGNSGLKLKEWELTDGRGGMGRSPRGVWSWVPKEEQVFAMRKAAKKV